MSERTILQVALDFLELTRALKAAKEAVAGGADWVEAGTPLIKSEGLDAVRALRKEFPQQTIVADMKILDTGRIEMEAAAKAGADLAVVMGHASEATIRECIEAGRNYGIQVAVDLLHVADGATRAQQAEEWGAHVINWHISIDDQMQGADPFEQLKKIAESVSIPIAVAGGINSETAAQAVKAGASIIIVGGAIIKSADAKAAAQAIRQAMDSGEAVPTSLYKRTAGEAIREILQRVSTANISDAGHRTVPLEGIRPILDGLKVVGPAVTVRTCPGDWAKPVEAIDGAKEGDVIVIDAGGAGPAIWGELATHSAVAKKLAGVVIDGAIRDTKEIKELNFPAFSRIITPQAGEPKGFGEIGVPIRISGITIEPGDWIVGDDDGVTVIPKARAAELTNRAMDCLERENRIRAEIEQGQSTLSQVQELLRWEKKGS